MKYIRSFILLIVSAACGAPQTEIIPVHVERPELHSQWQLNGKHKNFAFENAYCEGVAVGSGFLYEIKVPREPVSGHSEVGELWANNATARAEFGSGLSGTLDTSKLPESVSFKVECRAPGTFEVKLELKSSSEKIADAFEVQCFRPERLEPYSGAWTAVGPPSRAFVGGVLNFEPGVWSQNSEGKYIELCPRQPAYTVEDGQLVELTSPGRFKMLRTGLKPRIKAMGLEGTLPVEIVDVPWSIKVELPIGRMPLTAHAIDDQGEPLSGLYGCAFVAHQGDTKVQLTAFADVCWTLGDRGAQTDWDNYNKADRVCVEALGKSTCVDVTH